jgi:hypothetical protein
VNGSGYCRRSDDISCPVRHRSAGSAEGASIRRPDVAFDCRKSTSVAHADCSCQPALTGPNAIPISPTGTGRCLAIRLSREIQADRPKSDRCGRRWSKESLAESGYNAMRPASVTDTCKRRTGCDALLAWLLRRSTFRYFLDVPASNGSTARTPKFAPALFASVQSVP